VDKAMETHTHTEIDMDIQKFGWLILDISKKINPISDQMLDSTWPSLQSDASSSEIGLSLTSFIKDI
jgi:hypothetical protein